ncbi:MAG: glycoside hydrolase family 11 protein [Defluviitaleaceae bacterium]|nr:glycoside hydrolase family 11 protein [Defluviitaleaceae bacterium]
MKKLARFTLFLIVLSALSLNAAFAEPTDHAAAEPTDHAAAEPTAEPTATEETADPTANDPTDPTIQAFNLTRVHNLTAPPNRHANNSTSGRVNGFDYEAWTDDRGAEGMQMEIFSNGSFTGTWTSTYNSLFRVGRRFPGPTNSRPRLDSLDTISVAYNATAFTSNRGATYLTLYGWTESPMIEWYIIDGWRNYVPSSSAAGYTSHGTITANGATYDILTNWRVNQPSLSGNATFLQIFSVRRNSSNRPTPISGTIDVSAHFDAWSKIPTQTHSGTGTTASFSPTARLYEVSFTVEGFGGDSRSTGTGAVEYLCIVNGTDIACTNNGCTHCGGGGDPIPDTLWTPALASAFFEPRGATVTPTDSGLTVSGRGTGEHDHNNGIFIDIPALRALFGASNPPPIVIRGTVAGTTAGRLDLQGTGVSATVSTSNRNFTITVPSSAEITEPWSGATSYPFLGTAEALRNVNFTITDVTVAGISVLDLVSRGITPPPTQRARLIVPEGREAVLQLRALGLPTGDTLANTAGLQTSAGGAIDVHTMGSGIVRVSVPAGSGGHWRGVDILPTGYARNNTDPPGTSQAPLYPASQTVEILPGDVISVLVTNQGTAANTISIQAGSSAATANTVASASVAAGGNHTITFTVTQDILNLISSDMTSSRHNHLRIRGNQVSTTWFIHDILIHRAIPENPPDPTDPVIFWKPDRRITPADPLVTQMGNGNHLLRLEISDINRARIANSTGDGVLRFSFSPAWDTSRRILAWTDLSSYPTQTMTSAGGTTAFTPEAVSRENITFATSSNIAMGDYAATGQVRMTNSFGNGTTETELAIPRALLVSGGVTANYIYVILTVDIGGGTIPGSNTAEGTDRATRASNNRLNTARGSMGAAAPWAERDVISQAWLDISFTEPTTYEVTFNLNGGTHTGGGNLTQTISQNAAATAPIAERSGYVLSWDTSFTNITSNTTVTAQWLRLGAVSTNGLGAVSSADVVWLARAIAGHAGFTLPVPSSPMFAVADLNGDGVVNAADVSAFMRWLVWGA